MKKFVDSYCNYLKKKGIIVSDEQLEICAYGLELIVSAILNIVILVMCSFVLHEEKVYQLVYCAWWSDYYCTGNCCSNRFYGHYLSV